MDAHALRAARQLVATNAFMGVEFVPLMGEFGACATVEEVEPVAEAAAPRPPVAPSSPARASAREPAVETPAPVMVEAKPRVLNAGQQKNQAALHALRAKYEKDAPHSGFVTDHHCIVFGDGDPCARLMVIGEAPGAEEDKVGLPFVGRAGQLLEKQLGAMGLKRSDVYITNVLKTRPPNNATPTADEAAACAPYLYEQIRIIGPEAILALGLPASRVLLNTAESMSRLRGKWADYRDPRDGAYRVPVMPTYHPAFLLRAYTRENREKVWSDLKMVMDRLGLAAPSA